MCLYKFVCVSTLVHVCVCEYVCFINLCVCVCESKLLCVSVCE